MSYCTADVPDQDHLLCEEFLNGGIDAFALIQCDVTFSDYTSNAEWNTKLAAGQVLRFIGPGIKGEFPEPTPAKVDNPSACGSAQIVTGWDFTFTATDANSTATNDTAYALVNGRRFKLAWHECETGLIKVTEECVTIIATPVTVPGSNKELQMYKITAEWSGGRTSHPQRYDEPDGFFDAAE